MTLTPLRSRLRIWSRPAMAVCLTTALYFLLPLRRADLTGVQPVVRGVLLLVGLAALTALTARQVRRALTRGRFAERIAILVTLVYVVVVFFAALYVVLRDQMSGLDTRLDGLYFAVTTLTTVGYGDITPIGQAARTVVIAQMLFDLIIVTSAISIVIGALRPPDAPAETGDATAAAARSARPSMPAAGTDTAAGAGTAPGTDASPGTGTAPGTDASPGTGTAPPPRPAAPDHRLGDSEGASQRREERTERGAQPGHISWPTPCA